MIRKIFINTENYKTLCKKFLSKYFYKIIILILDKCKNYKKYCS